MEAEKQKNKHTGKSGGDKLWMGWVRAMMNTNSMSGQLIVVIMSQSHPTYSTNVFCLHVGVVVVLLLVRQIGAIGLLGLL